MKNHRVLKLSAVAGAILIAGLGWLNPSLAALNDETPAMPGPAPPADSVALFSAKCAGCHGKDGRGTPTWKTKGQPSFTDAKFQGSRSDAQIGDAIKNGKGKFMPAWKEKLTDDEIQSLVARVRSFANR